MKRIIGRKMLDNQVIAYPESTVIDPVDLDHIGTCPTPYRFGWASNIIDELFSKGLACRRYLDIGTFNGLMAFLAAVKRASGNPISVDAIEGWLPAYQYAERNAEILRSRGHDVRIHNIMFEDYETALRYDVITAFEIFEHFKDPVFCLEKVYELLAPGGHFMMTVPEESGAFGLADNNCWHYWTSTIQSMVFVMFSNDKKWRIKEMFNKNDLIHILVIKI